MRTKQEFMKFVDELMDKRMSYLAFMILYWTGIRIGELLALTPGDIDLERHTISITKSYQRLGKKDVVTEPKTPKSRITLIIFAKHAEKCQGDFICKEIIRGLGKLPFSKIGAE